LYLLLLLLLLLHCGPTAAYPSPLAALWLLLLLLLLLQRWPSHSILLPIVVWHGHIDGRSARLAPRHGRKHPSALLLLLQPLKVVLLRLLRLVEAHVPLALLRLSDDLLQPLLLLLLKLARLLLAHLLVGHHGPQQVHLPLALLGALLE
jgi:hypothetical protein